MRKNNILDAFSKKGFKTYRRATSLAACMAAIFMMPMSSMAAELPGVMPEAPTVPAASDVMLMPPAMPPANPPVDSQMPMPPAMPAAPALSANPDIAFLQAVQMEIVQKGIDLNKYHIINVLGDSLAEGIGASGPDKSFPAVLAKLTGARVNNYGVSGSRITDIESPYTNPGSYVDRMYGMSKNADLIIVFGGTNDFWFGDCPIGNRTDSGVNTFYGALNKIMSYLKNAYSNADIVFVTPYQQGKDASMTRPPKRTTYGNFGTGTLKQYRTAIIDRCEYYGIPVLDLYADYDLNTVDNRKALEAYGSSIVDGCHLNDNGYRLLACKLYKFIMQDFSLYVPEYTEINDMVFETAALPALIDNGNFVMPNGKIIPSKPGFEVEPLMPLQQLYQHLIVSAMH